MSEKIFMRLFIEVDGAEMCRADGAVTQEEWDANLSHDARQDLMDVRMKQLCRVVRRHPEWNEFLVTGKNIRRGIRRGI